MPRNDIEKWQMDLEEYIRQGEPEKSEKSTAWKTAIGLQDVDGLKTSEYLLETAKEHIEGRIDIKTAQIRIQSYYEQRQSGRLFTNGCPKISSPHAGEYRTYNITKSEKEQSAIQSAKSAIEKDSKCNNCTLEELAILKELLNNPSITQKELAGIIGKSERTIKTRTVEMQEKGLIRRENGKRNGRWEVLVKL